MLVKASQKGLDEVMTAAEMFPADWKICKISYGQKVSTVQTRQMFSSFPTKHQCDSSQNHLREPSLMNSNRGKHKQRGGATPVPVELLSC